MGIAWTLSSPGRLDAAPEKKEEPKAAPSSSDDEATPEGKQLTPAPGQEEVADETPAPADAANAKKVAQAEEQEEEQPPAEEGPQPAEGAQAEPASPDTSSEHLPEEQLRKMIQEEMAKGIKPKVGDVSMHGYFRTGFGVSSEKGRAVCFQTPGAFSKFRLGNECDQYGEWLFSSPAYVGDDGVVGTANIMFNLFLPTDTLGHGAGIGTALGFPQIWFDLRNIDFLGGGTPWIGRRYYKREDIHITDFFYWNASGLGGGIEDINAGSMKFSYAAFVVDGADPTVRTEIGIRNDLRLYGIQLHPGGELRVGINAILDASDSDATENGFAGNIMYVLAALGGENKLTLQYGIGPGIDLGASAPLTTSTDAKRLRVVDAFYLQPTPELGSQLEFVFQHDDNGDTTADWISAGGRLSYALHEHAKIHVEAGLDTTKVEDGDRLTLTKVTVSPALVAAKGFWARPELRLFATIAFWNDATTLVGPDRGAGLYTPELDKTAGATFGMQAEGWW